MTSPERLPIGRDFTFQEKLLIRRLLYLSDPHDGFPYFSLRVIREWWWEGGGDRRRALINLQEVGIIETHRYLPTVYRLAPRYVPALRELTEDPDPLTEVRV